MKLPNSAKDFEKIMKNVDFTRVLQITVPILQPVIIGGLWLLISKFDKRADALSKLIAIAEPIPTIDLNVPKPVVLASLFDFTEDFIEIVNKIIANTIDLPSNVKDSMQNDIKIMREKAEEAKKKVTDPITDIIDAFDLFIRTGKTKPTRREGQPTPEEYQ